MKKYPLSSSSSFTFDTFLSSAPLVFPLLASLLCLTPVHLPQLELRLAYFEMCGCFTALYIFRKSSCRMSATRIETQDVVKVDAIFKATFSHIKLLGMVPFLPPGPVEDPHSL